MLYMVGKVGWRVYTSKYLSITYYYVMVYNIEMCAASIVNDKDIFRPNINPSVEHYIINLELGSRWP